MKYNNIYICICFQSNTPIYYSVSATNGIINCLFKWKHKCIFIIVFQFYNTTGHPVQKLNNFSLASLPVGLFGIYQTVSCNISVGNIIQSKVRLSRSNKFLKGDAFMEKINMPWKNDTQVFFWERNKYVFLTLQEKTHHYNIIRSTANISALYRVFCLNVIYSLKVLLHCLLLEYPTSGLNPTARVVIFVVVPPRVTLRFRRLNCRCLQLPLWKWTKHVSPVIWHPP